MAPVPPPSTLPPSRPKVEPTQAPSGTDNPKVKTAGTRPATAPKAPPAREPEIAPVVLPTAAPAAPDSNFPRIARCGASATKALDSARKPLASSTRSWRRLRRSSRAFDSPSATQRLMRPSMTPALMMPVLKSQPIQLLSARRGTSCTSASTVGDVQFVHAQFCASDTCTGCAASDAWKRRKRSCTSALDITSSQGVSHLAVARLTVCGASAAALLAGIASAKSRKRWWICAAVRTSLASAFCSSNSCKLRICARSSSSWSCIRASSLACAA
mmetsp:Transcript_42933/g.93428  ORF Transcript_42933/g.93428 Transcript_42933/m.93428 type:complete len:272 (-) Transcript_42933:159-974(-)